MISLFKAITILGLVAVAGYLGMKILDNKGVPATAVLKDEAGRLLEAVKSTQGGEAGKDDGSALLAKTQPGKNGPLDEADKALTKSVKGTTPSIPITPLAESQGAAAESSEAGSEARVSEMTALYEKTSAILNGIE